MNERTLAAIGMALLLCAWLLLPDRRAPHRVNPRATTSALVAAVAALGLAIAVRWLRLGHGPFLDLFEILLSNVFSLSAALVLGSLLDARVRAAVRSALPVLLLLGAWLLTVPVPDSVLPPTYENPVLWLHVAASKVFLGLSLLALALAVHAHRAARSEGPSGPVSALAVTEPVAGGFERAAWRYLGAALAAQTLLLVAGAWWAQDAWGRYWDWDPLEAWAFITWLAAAAAVHARLRSAWPMQRTLWVIAAVFVLAFWTFFGIPFISTAPHKGAI